MTAREHHSPRYVVGIDLGTTHSVLAYADLHDPAARPQLFEVEQLIAPGQVMPRRALPSAVYQAGGLELSESERTLPWREEAPIVGELALSLGEAQPGRLVSSAKSWLSHSAVDRSAAILPWGSDDPEVEKISPVEASQQILAHLRDAWDHAHPDAKLRAQEVVLTVPASFDEGARAHTLSAARAIGLKVKLVEEPQAAFYAWLDAHREDVPKALGDAQLVIVVDVGGGTTDLSLIRVELRESGPRLTRLAVGDHLLLGGDNMDVALARKLEHESGSTLSTTRFTQLVQRCRAAKERLLSSAGDDAPTEATLTLVGGGARLVGGTRSMKLSRADVEAMVVDGFFPFVTPDASPARRGGIVEFGLPYAAEPAITKHIAEFLRLQRASLGESLRFDDLRGRADLSALRPDAVLFNGGVFSSPILKARVRDVLAQWRGDEVAILEGDQPAEAVALGAVAYGLSRRGVGLKIGGGSPRSYYLMLDADAQAQRAVCILPKGTEESEQVTLSGRSFLLQTGRPVRFHLASATSDVQHIEPGAIVTIDDPERYRLLPPIAAVIDDAGDKEVPVVLAAALTEIGTLEMSCLAREGDRRWKLEFQLRGKAEQEGAARVAKLHPRFEEASERVRVIYGSSKDKSEIKPSEIKRVRRDLEQILGPREAWDTPLLRELFGSLLAGKKRRRRSADHERIWFNLVGYTLRPGFGYPLDKWRVQQIQDELLKAGVQFVKEAQNCSEYWIMWRRISGGLDREAQEKLMSTIAWYLHPPTRTPRKRPPGPKLEGYEDMVRLAGALERVDVQTKAQIGGWLVERLEKHQEHADTWWAVGRIGARVPFYGSAHEVVPRHVATQWLEAALRLDFKRTPQAALAATLLARRSGDRQRDLEDALREKVAARLQAAKASASWVRLVHEIAELQDDDQKRILGDSLPPGLRLID